MSDPVIGVTLPAELEEELDLTGLCESEFDKTCCLSICGFSEECIGTIIKRYYAEPPAPDDEPEKEFNKAGCNGCINSLKRFSKYPCVVCGRNSDCQDGYYNDYYHNGE
jgi:hypothetical protein